MPHDVIMSGNRQMSELHNLKWLGIWGAIGATMPAVDTVAAVAGYYGLKTAFQAASLGYDSAAPYRKKFAEKVKLTPERADNIKKWLVKGTALASAVVFSGFVAMKTTEDMNNNGTPLGQSVVKNTLLTGYQAGRFAVADIAVPTGQVATDFVNASFEALTGWDAPERYEMPNGFSTPVFDRHSSWRAGCFEPGAHAITDAFIAALDHQILGGEEGELASEGRQTITLKDPVTNREGRATANCSFSR